MPHNIVEIDGAIGKTVKKITVTNESDFRVITIRFAAGQRFTLPFTLGLKIEPELVDWTTGDGEALKEYPTIYEHNND
jgi:hypothetical protein